MELSDSPLAPASRDRRQDAKTLLIVLGATLASGALYFHIEGINGPKNWQWIYRKTPMSQLFPLLAACAIPFFLAQWLYLRSQGRRVRTPIVLLATCTLGMQLTYAWFDGPVYGLSRIAQVVQSKWWTSYYTVAVDWAAGPSGHLPQGLWATLANYPAYMDKLPGHAAFRPPGLPLFCLAWVKLFGANAGTATAIGVTFGLLGCVSIAAVFSLARDLGASRDAAFCAASSFALCPGLVSMYPMPDCANPLLACALLITWTRALATGRPVYAVASGIVLFVSTMIGYHLLVLGFFVVLYPLLDLPRAKFVAAGQQLTGIRAPLFHGLLALGVMLALYLLFWAFTGFNPVTTFLHARSGQRGLVEYYHWIYPYTILTDLTDFALGEGWLPLLLALGFIGGRLWDRSSDRRSLKISILCLAQVVALALSGQVSGETARIWVFLQPLIMIPAGMELARWDFASRQAAYLSMWAITASIARNLRFTELNS